jgi:aspartyl-tRNA(Asn)/glutamyl-tRNA(Gln) amidotransferase subunit A
MATHEWDTIESIAAAVSSGSTPALHQVEKALQAIEEGASYNALISVTKTRAIERAKEIDKRIKNGEKVGPLAGVPFIAKDNFLTFGSDTTAASNILKGFQAPYQGTAIEKLESAGAICVAKANLDAFAHGSSTENSDFFTTLNPHDKTRVPGGSSGGSAAAVVLGMAPFALGTDTGGSIRLPASFCGAVGYKPTYGLVSRYGVVAMASSTDVIGPIAKTVRDAEMVLDVLAGRDPFDSTTIERDAKGYLADPLTIKGTKIGVVKEYLSGSLSDEVRERIEQAITTLKEQGAVIEEVSLPSLPLALACYYVIVPAEVSSNLSRYDGQRYGFSATESSSLDDSFEESRSMGFGAEAKRRIMIGTYVLSSGYYDAYYKKAQQLRTKLIEEFSATFKKVDFLLGPVAPMTAFKIGENAHDPLQMYLADIMTVAINLVGVPAISVPTPGKGLPIGLQLIAAQREDRALLALAAAYEGVVK